jgi:mannose-6-phosphate isomerase-like protein (cupin superfamily)
MQPGEIPYEARDERILDVLPLVHLDVSDEQIEVTSLRGTWNVNPSVIWKPEALVALESFKAGEVTRYQFWHNEVQYILDGEATLTYSLPITRFSKERELHVVKGDAYVIPLGADIKFAVSEGGPLQKLCVAMPGPARYRNDLREAGSRWPSLSKPEEEDQK